MRTREFTGIPAKLEGTSDKAVIAWLIILCVVIITMVGVGGATRLTESGLSMVSWKPISGVVPPTSDAQWQAEFEQYKQYPEYQKVNRGMSLDQFKSIFYWEYGHRMLGRSIGVLFFVPFVAFYLLGKISKSMMPRFIGAFVLGGLQGLMGWYMVMSGLVDKPDVSHYRLAAHLSLAIIILVYLQWLVLDLLTVPQVVVEHSFRRLQVALLGVLALQILYGAFTAGLRAGLGFNTYPLMDGSLMAEAATMMSPFVLNFFENGAMIQFVHRWLGFLLLVLGAVLLGLALRQRLPATVVKGCVALLAVIFVQYLLGVLTLINYVPIPLAVAHQVFACVVVMTSAGLFYSTSTKARAT